MSLFLPNINPEARVRCIRAGERSYDPCAVPAACAARSQDATVNILGARPQDPLRVPPYDNVGVQYGLQALARGR